MTRASHAASSPLRRPGGFRCGRVPSELFEAIDISSGYINGLGEILPKFDPKNPHFELKVPPEFADLRFQIVDEINRKVLKNRIVNARDRRELRFRKEVQLSPDFQVLWEKIKHRTRYRVTFDTGDPIEQALARIKQIEPIKAARIATTVVAVDISDAGVVADRQIATRVREAEQVEVLPDIFAFLQKETELTRHTLAEILKRSGRLAEFKVNPHAFMAAVATEISRALHDLMLEGIKYEKVAGQYWEQSRARARTSRTWRLLLLGLFIAGFKAPPRKTTKTNDHD